MEKPTSLSAHRVQKIFRAWPILLVFFLALLTRLYWIHEKEYMYIDDPTSVSLAYNLPGWGKKTFEATYPYGKGATPTMLHRRPRGTGRFVGRFGRITS